MACTSHSRELVVVHIQTSPPETLWPLLHRTHPNYPLPPTIRSCLHQSVRFTSSRPIRTQQAPRAFSGTTWAPPGLSSSSFSNESSHEKIHLSIYLCKFKYCKEQRARTANQSLKREKWCLCAHYNILWSIFTRISIKILIFLNAGDYTLSQ